MNIKPSILSHLSRVTSSTRFIPAIDGLRFLAIMLVVLYHLVGDLWKRHPDVHLIPELRGVNSLLQSANFGVDMFFVISGFVLALPFAKQHLNGEHPVSLRQYFVRRVTRIEPPYIIALSVWTIAIATFRGRPILSFVHDFLLSLFYLNNFFQADLPKICFVGWSLEVEVQFYILAPAIAAVFLLKNTFWRRLLIVAAISLFAILQIHIGPGKNVLLFMHYFLLGFLLCDYYVLEWQEKAARPVLWDIAGTCAWIGLVYLLVVGPVDFAAVVCLFFAYAGVLRGTLLSKIFRQPLLVTVGGMCYTIYLYHSLILSALFKTFDFYLPTDSYEIALLYRVVLFIPAVIAVSAIIFAVTERPFMQTTWTTALTKYGKKLFQTSTT